MPVLRNAGGVFLVFNPGTPPLEHKVCVSYFVTASKGGWQMHGCSVCWCCLLETLLRTEFSVPVLYPDKGFYLHPKMLQRSLEIVF